MPSSAMQLDLELLRAQLQTIESHYVPNALVIYAPKLEHAGFFDGLSQQYWAAAAPERRRMRSLVAENKGVSNCLLGYLNQAMEQLTATRDPHWLCMGLAAAAMQGGEGDMRDWLWALARLYVTAEAIGIAPQPEFDALVGAGIPANFGDYAVVRSVRESAPHHVTRSR